MNTRVLLVDSNREFAILIRQSLEESGAYAVSLASSGEDALSLASDEDFELAIVDLDLHDFQGTEIVRQLRSIQPEIKIVAIPTTGSEELEVEEALDLDGVLTKPFYLPDLPRILREALAGPRPEPQHAAAPPDDTPLQPETKATGQLAAIPPQLQHPEQAAERIQAGLQASEALFALLLKGDEPLAHAGELSPGQLRALVQSVPDLGAADKPGTVTRYLRLPDRPQDDLLYAAPIANGLALALVFPAEVPFGTVRRESRALADSLLQSEDPDQRPAEGELNTGDANPEAPPASLPGDWVPETELNAAQQSMLEEWADLEPPEADPVAESPEEPAGTASTQPEELPDDWVPRQRPPASRLNFVEERPPAPTDQSQELSVPDQSMQEARYHLPFTAVLIPRFPEHQLTGALARHLREWTRRLCVAWDWRAEEIDVEPDALKLRVSLIPESAPADAVERLREDLSRRILERYPQFKDDLPSGRFWARGYLLTAGEPPGPERIRRFIAHTREAQGFEA